MEARLAASQNTERAQKAIGRLREAGPEGLAELMAANEAAIKAHLEGHLVVEGEAKAAWERVRSAIDQVAEQRDAWASGLYWYTDLEKAQAAAKESGKPILSLRMLGKLCDEYSCANSRFFRTTLYSNAEISAYLREHFILHWKSVRPVPVVTIDMGDGRTIRRTITGNSIHYVLSPDGRVIDALPGLYGPAAFLRGVKDGEAAVASAKGMEGEELEKMLAAYHNTSAARLERQWNEDFQKVGGIATAAAAGDVRAIGAIREGGANPPAMRAARAAIGKSVVERPILAAAALGAEVLEKVSDEAIWEKIAALHAADARLDATTTALIRAKNPEAELAGMASISKMYVETPLVKAVKNFQKSAAQDTVRNEYRFHLKIHQWLAGEMKQTPVEALNERVYAELFLTPSWDPWLGLAPANVFTALDGDGVCRNAK